MEPSVCVLAPGVLLTVTIEPVAGGPDDTTDIHLHPGGQGFWIARMLRQLGERPVVCGPAGGETGRTIRALMDDWDIDFRPIMVQGHSAARIHDRRSGHRAEVARTPPPVLDRHEIDDLYGKMLELSLATRSCVATGVLPGDGIGLGIFTRLGADLAAGGVRVVADMHGPELDAWLEGGRIDLLKVSDEDLIADGRLHSDSEEEAICAMKRLADLGATSVVVSRGPRPALASIAGVLYRVHPPDVSVVDASGAGDSMTGALTSAFLAKVAPADMLRLACAAGSANVARHGLATGSADLIRQLAHEVTVEEVGAA
jgi:1-phosphofructokinase